MPLGQSLVLRPILLRENLQPYVTEEEPGFHRLRKLSEAGEALLAHPASAESSAWLGVELVLYWSVNIF